MSAVTPDTFLFDLAGVLIDWDVGPLYLDVFGGDHDAVRTFFDTVMTPAPLAAIATGRSTQAVIGELIEQFPRYRTALEAWWRRWDEMLTGPLPDTVGLSRRLRAAGYRTCILGNWGREEFDRARPRFEFLDEFDGVVISGDVGAMKPASAIYRAAIERLGLEPSRTLFIDDKADNVEAAERHGLQGHVFVNAKALEQSLAALNVEL